MCCCFMYLCALQRKTQELFRMNIAFVVVLCCISMVSFLFFNDEFSTSAGHRSSSVSHLKNKHQGSALKTVGGSHRVSSACSILF